MTEVTKKDLQNWKEEIKKDSEHWKDEIKKDSEHWKEEIVRQNQVMYEKFHAEVKVIGEQYLSLQEKIDGQGKKIHSLFEMVAQNSVDITIIKGKLSKIEDNISEIKKTLETKADAEKIKKLEKDIVLLKQKIA